jgi:hypothetical protein
VAAFAPCGRRVEGEQDLLVQLEVGLALNDDRLDGQEPPPGSETRGLGYDELLVLPGAAGFVLDS